MSRVSDFIEYPRSGDICRRLHIEAAKTCEHGRDPCYLRCGVRRVDGMWRVITRDERIEWIEGLQGKPVDAAISVDPLDCDYTIIIAKRGGVPQQGFVAVVMVDGTEVESVREMDIQEALQKARKKARLHMDKRIIKLKEELRQLGVTI